MNQSNLKPEAEQPSEKPRRRWRWPVVGVLLLIVAGLLRVSFLQGIFKPVRITGASMATALMGDHYRVACVDCAVVFRCDAGNAPGDGYVVCPNCGHNSNQLKRAQPRRGQRVLIDRFPLLYRNPRRWELVAFHLPKQPDTLGVKRVVGLPGERVALRQGDLYIDGQIQRKTIDQLREVAVLVHDDRYRATRDEKLPPRWQGDLSQTGWQRVEDGFAFKSTAADEWDWLTYRHFPCLPPPSRRDEEKPIWDSYGYNQNVSRTLQEATDLMLTCRLQMEGGTRAALLAHDGHESFRIELSTERNVARLVRDGKTVATVTTPWLAGRRIQWELALCDQQVLLAADGQVLIRYPYQRAAGPLQPTSRPLGIAAAGGGVRVADLRVFRDLHYRHHLDARATNSPWQRENPLASDEYFVLGDNVPVSVDSRYWSKLPLSGKLLVGRVLRSDR